MKTIVRQIYVMSSGTLTVEGSTLVPGTSFGQPKTIPVQYFLLETSKGYILVDTGNDPGVITDAVGAWGADGDAPAGRMQPSVALCPVCGVCSA